MLIYLLLVQKTVKTYFQQFKVLNINEIYSKIFLADFNMLWKRGQDWIDGMLPFSDLNDGDDILFDAIQSYRETLKVD